MKRGTVGNICFSRISENEDLMEAIRQRAAESRTKAGVFIVIGSLSNVVLGYYRDGKYEYIKLDGPLEIASCMGNIAVDEKNETVIHAHIVVSNERGEAFGGHLVKGSRVGATAELTIIEGLGIDLQRAFDEKTQLKLLRLS